MMAELLLVSALLPSFAIGLVLLARAQPMIAGAPSRAVANQAPQLYAIFILVAVIAAMVLTRFDGARLGLGAPSLLDSQLLGYVAALPTAVAVAVVAFFFELAVASPGSRRAVPRVSAPEPPEAATTTATLTRTATAIRPEKARTQSPALTAVTDLVRRPVIFGAIALVTAVGEEILFRGLLLGGLRENVPAVFALIVQAVMFGANHVSFGGRNVITKAISGLGWGVVTLAFGTVLVAAISHVFFQFLVYRRLNRQRSAS